MNTIKKAKQEIVRTINEQHLPPEILQLILGNISLEIEVGNLHNSLNMLNREIEEMKKNQEPTINIKEEMKNKDSLPKADEAKQK